MVKVTVESEDGKSNVFLCDACVLFAYRQGAAPNLYAEGESGILPQAIEKAGEAFDAYLGSDSSLSLPC